MRNDEKFLDRCIKIVFVSIFIFSALMIALFCIFGCTPDTLIQYYFIYVVGELLCCALIKTTKSLFINYRMNKQAMKEAKPSADDDHHTDGQNMDYINM